jgi:hypothetical protein
MEKLNNKYLYTKAIWFVIAGFVAILISIRFCVDQPASKNEFHMLSGKITEIRQGDLFSSRSNTTQNSTIICVDSVASAYVYNNKHVAILNAAKINIGDSCRIWVDTEVRKDIGTGEVFRNIIKAMSVNGEQLLDFKPKRWLAFTPFLYALIIFVPALLFVIKHPEILFGEKRVK